MIVHLLGTLDRGTFFLTYLDNERTVLPLRQTSLPISVFFPMSLCNCWVAFLTVTLRSRVKDSYGSRDCASRDTDLLRDSQWDTDVACGWGCTQLLAMLTFTWLKSQCEFGVCSSSGLWGSGCSFLSFLLCSPMIVRKRNYGSSALTLDLKS